MADRHLGLIGAGVMGCNLALNMADHGVQVTVYDTDGAKVDAWLAREGGAAGVRKADSFAALAGALPQPRICLMMVPAGAPVDACIDGMSPHLDRGDILIDGGNSHYRDTARRVAAVEADGKLFVGAGVSGGAEGARNGPSIMPGGSKDAWPHVGPILTAIAARADDGEPCCDWVGPEGAGHFVKMVHNGIEYGDMQLICEAYHLLREGAGMSLAELHDVFGAWNTRELESYLIEITRDILAHEQDGQPTLDLILDAAAQKGTGMWTAVAALETGQPLSLVGEAVFARNLSAFKEERVAAAAVLPKKPAAFSGDRETFVADVERALYLAKLTSYAQGFQLMRAVAQQSNWSLDYGGVAKLWRAGCIIRSAFLGEIAEAYEREADLTNLLLASYFRDALLDDEDAWRRVVAQGVALGIPLPAMSAGLAYLDGYRTARLPANLLQAQRDFFGAHTYERVDRPRGETFHTEWTSEA